jgi:hypothetical protein
LKKLRYLDREIEIMRLFGGKPNKRCRYGDLKRLISSCEEIYWSELSKDEHERDAALMSECLDTISYAQALLRGGRRTEAKQPCVHTLARRVLAYSLAIIIFIAASTGIAYAFGIDVWKTIITGQIGYIDYSGKSNPGNTPDPIEFPTTPSNGYKEYNSIDDACAELRINPLIFDLTNYNFRIHNILGAGSGANISLSIEYQNDSGNYFYYTYNMFPSADTAFVITAESKTGEYDAVSINGIEHIITYNEGETAVIWNIENSVYHIITDIEGEELLELLSMLYMQ